MILINSIGVICAKSVNYGIPENLKISQMTQINNVHESVIRENLRNPLIIDFPLVGGWRVLYIPS